MPQYRLHDTAGDDVGLIEHPAPNLEPGDVVELAEGGAVKTWSERKRRVTEFETSPGPLDLTLDKDPRQSA